MVQTVERAPKGGHPVLFGYGYATLAVLFGFRSVGSVRNAVARRAFDPADLASIFAFYEKRRNRRTRT